MPPTFAKRPREGSAQREVGSSHSIIGVVSNCLVLRDSCTMQRKWSKRACQRKPYEPLKVFIEKAVTLCVIEIRDLAPHDRESCCLVFLKLPSVIRRRGTSDTNASIMFRSRSRISTRETVQMPVRATVSHTRAHFYHVIPGVAGGRKVWENISRLRVVQPRKGGRRPNRAQR